MISALTARRLCYIVGDGMSELPANTRQDVLQKGGFVGVEVAASCHNFYFKRTGLAITQLILSITIVGLLITCVWILIDAFLIPGWVRDQNNLLAAQLGA